MIEGPVTVTLERIAHGGHVVGRHEGRVVFVRHGIPGETVTVRVTGEGRKGRFLFGDVVEVLESSPDRVAPPCRLAAVCGGCDFQHIALSRQRQLKAEVLAEQLDRLGGVALPVTVQAADETGLGWRTRLRLTAGPDGWGLRRHGSHEVVHVEHCPIATDGVNRVLADAGAAEPGDELVIVDQPDAAVRQQLPTQPPVPIRETAGGRDWHLDTAGFWQAHVAAPEVLLAAVAPHVADAARWWDLYCGVGLFAGALATARQEVVAVEGDRRSAAQARRNLADLPRVGVVRADVAQWLARRRPGHDPDVVVLDPPRSGAGAAVVSALTATAAGRLVYVACDPAALGRDVGLLRKAGWELAQVTGYDLFPMTHHMETVAVLTR